jgi:ribonuclease BN (tRNA processing enzyme)
MTDVVRVTVAGSGDAFGTGGRLQTCLHVRRQGVPEALLIDCGASALIGLKRFGLEPNDVGAVAVSHLHGDHFGGLPFLILDGQFRRRSRPLHVIGPPGLAARLRQAMEVFFPGSTKVERRFAVSVHELVPGSPPVHIDGFSIGGLLVNHPSGALALALRVETAGRTIAYSGDTAWTESLIEAADDADLFVCEAYTLDRPARHHLHLPDLRANADRLNCRRLLLTHAGPQVLAADQIEFDLARDGMVLDL